MEKILLHVGCGSSTKANTTRGFRDGDWRELRYDINPDVRPDIQGSMTDMSAVADGSVDAVFSSHNIEHLYPHEVPKALAEFHRVLKPDGFVVITCPDLQSVCARVVSGGLDEVAYDSPAGPIAPIDILYGHRAFMAAGNLFMAHRTGFTEKTLQAGLMAAGFPRVATFAIPAAYDLWALASKGRPSDGELQQLAMQYCFR